MKADGDPRVVLITGAGGGLGSALVTAFAAAGWRVAAAWHHREPAAIPGGGLSLRLEVTDSGSVAAAVAQVQDRWGRIDALVNNAGVARDQLLVRMEDAVWDEVLAVNLRGAFLCARAALPGMVGRGEGVILNVASFAARGGGAGQGAYAAAKAGLIGLTLSLAREVGSLGIRVNAVLPGVLPTAMTSGLGPETLATYAAANALGRINEPVTVARQIVQVAEAREISGQVIALDSRIARWT